MDLVRQLEIFVAVRQRASFSGAARALGVSPAAVSAAVSTLEARWGARLFERTTRAMVLTDTGKALLERGRRVLQEVEAAEAIAASAATQVRGTVRVSVPVSYGLRVLAPLFTSFLERNPGVDLVVDLTDRRVDLLAEGGRAAPKIAQLIEHLHATLRRAHATKDIAAISTARVLAPRSRAGGGAASGK